MLKQIPTWRIEISKHFLERCQKFQLASYEGNLKVIWWSFDVHLGWKEMWWKMAKPQKWLLDMKECTKYFVFIEILKKTQLSMKNEKKVESAIFGKKIDFPCWDFFNQNFDILSYYQISDFFFKIFEIFRFFWRFSDFRFFRKCQFFFLHNLEIFQIFKIFSQIN